MTISCSKKEIDSWRPAVLTDNGLIPEESIITMTKPFYAGSMKRINSESYLCKKEVISRQFSKDWLTVRKLLNQSLSSVLVLI
jgi:hypothetical protein